MQGVVAGSLPIRFMQKMKYALPSVMVVSQPVLLPTLTPVVLMLIR